MAASFTITTSGGSLTSGGTVTGNLVITGTLNVGGVVTFDVAQTIQGALTIDLTNTESLLVRKNADAGDVFLVNTTVPSAVLGSFDTGNDARSPFLKIGNNTNSSQKSGAHIEFVDLGGTSYYFHVDDAGAARLGTTIPIGSADLTNSLLGGGSVSISGTPANNQLAIWTDSSTIEGDATLTWDGTKFLVGDVGSDALDETPPEDFTVITGNIEAYDAGSLASESVTDGAFPDSTNWAGSGEWSDTISGAAIFTFSSTGNGTMTQALADLAIAGKNNRWYKLTYTTSSVVDAGGLTMTLTSAFAASTVTLSTASGTYSVIFQSNSSADAADLVFDITSASGSDVLTLDDVILKEIIGGDMIVAGTITGGGANGIIVDGDGEVRFAPAGTNDGHVHILSPSNSRIGLIVEMPSGAATNTVQFHLDGSNTMNFLFRPDITLVSLLNRDLGNNIVGCTLAIGRNTNGTQASGGVIEWTDLGGLNYRMHADDSGVLRIGTTVPVGTSDTTNGAVGAQSSPEAFKNLLRKYSAKDSNAILQQVLATDVWDFTYNDLAPNGYTQVFTGVAVPDGEHPWFGMDPVLDNHPTLVEGTARALNEVNVAGYTILSIKALNDKIERLESQVVKLLEK